jgi:Uma2 family endonuclease
MVTETRIQQVLKPVKEEPAYTVASSDEQEPLMVPPEAMPQVDHLITEDDTPVDNIFSEKQQRLLTEPLYTSWVQMGEKTRPFVAFANVGLFYTPRNPALVPDVLLSMDVALPDDIWTKGKRSYFVWEYGKSPDMVIEIVSDTRGGEDSRKLEEYARMGIWYYVAFDPQEHLKQGKLRIYELTVAGGYVPREQRWFERIGLGLTLWQGTYENREDEWLRWCDHEGQLIPTGKEKSSQEHQRAEQEHQRAEQEQQRAEQERLRAEQEKQRAEQEHQRAELEYKRADRMAKKLRELGIDPETYLAE